MTTFTLPWPPSMNHYWRNVAGRTLISREGRQYRQKVVVHRPPFMKPIDGRVKVCITANPPDRRRRDLDNMLKPLLDALTHAQVWWDDSQIDDLHIVRGLPVAGGQITLEVADAKP